MNHTKNQGIYLHIPFCVKKCKYCDFLSFPLLRADTEGGEEKNGGTNCCKISDRAAYVEALISQIQKTRWTGIADTIYLGGGTPSILTPQQLSAILSEVRKNARLAPDVEITMEMNPGTVKKELLAAFVAQGGNRVSLGLQSTENQELQMLGRIHTYEEFLSAYKMVREAGIKNINVDVMSAIPKQTLKSYENTLKRIIKLRPEHISSYSLIVEEGTPFYEMEQNHVLEVVSEDEEREMYHLTNELLEAAGYQRYEISNYCLPEKESRHNLKYWSGNDYYGIGLGASSYIEGQRFHNTEDLSEYLSQGRTEFVKEDVEEISSKEQMEEFMYLGLRKIQGVRKEEFQEQFGVSIDEIYGDVLKKLEKEELLFCSQDFIALTQRGIDVSNRVFMEFLLDI